MMKYSTGRWMRVARIVVSLAMLAGVTAAVATGYATVLCRMQIVPALLSCSGLWLVAWVAVTALFGRVYCSSVCPLGTLQDLFIAVSRRRRRGFFYRAPRTALRWCVVAVAAGAALLGISLVTSLLDPYATYARMEVYLALPLVRPVAVSLLAGAVAGVTLLAVALCALLAGRTICTSVCPVGTLLGALSTYSLYHMDIDTDRCTGCNRCVRRCKAQCIDPSSHTVDVSRCVVCFDCVAACRDGAITYRRGRHRLRMPMLQPVGGAGSAGCDAPAAAKTEPVPLSRREFIAGIMSLAAAAASGRRPVSLEPLNHVCPPGAGEDFDVKCVSCGACVSVCPAGIIVPSGGELGWRNALHPVLDFNRGACLYDCTDCTHACPTGALQPLTPGEKHRFVLGKARIEPSQCFMYRGEGACGACVRRCPRRAITVVTLADGRRLPQVDFDACIGCGECRHVCPADPPAWIIEGR